MKEYRELSLEEANKLIDNYSECINCAFDAFTKVQDADMDLIDRILN